jgi:hypothetical protein
MLFLVLATCRQVGICQSLGEISVIIFKSENTLKMQTVYCTETLVSAYKSTWRQKLKE